MKKRSNSILDRKISTTKCNNTCLKSKHKDSQIIEEES